MATLKQRVHRKNSSGSYDTIYYETSSEVVIRPDGSTVEEALESLVPSGSGPDISKYNIGEVFFSVRDDYDDNVLRADGSEYDIKKYPELFNLFCSTKHEPQNARYLFNIQYNFLGVQGAILASKRINGYYIYVCANNSTKTVQYSYFTNLGNSVTTIDTGYTYSDISDLLPYSYISDLLHCSIQYINNQYVIFIGYGSTTKSYKAIYGSNINNITTISSNTLLTSNSSIPLHIYYIGSKYHIIEPGANPAWMSSPNLETAFTTVLYLSKPIYTYNQGYNGIAEIFCVGTSLYIIPVLFANNANNTSTNLALVIKLDASNNTETIYNVDLSTFIFTFSTLTLTGLSRLADAVYIENLDRLYIHFYSYHSTNDFYSKLIWINNVTTKLTNQSSFTLSDFNIFNDFTYVSPGSAHNYTKISLENGLLNIITPKCFLKYNPISNEIETINNISTTGYNADLRTDNEIFTFGYPYDFIVGDTGTFPIYLPTITSFSGSTYYQVGSPKNCWYIRAR